MNRECVVTYLGDAEPEDENPNPQESKQEGNGSPVELNELITRLLVLKHTLHLLHMGGSLHQEDPKIRI